MTPRTVVLEREAVVGDLVQRYGVVAGGRAGGALVLLAGEAGIGKTTVTRQLGDLVDGPVWRGQCDPLSTPRPLSPLLDIVDDPASGLAGLAVGLTQPYDVFAGLVRALGDLPEPALLVIEDVHWADGATLDMLRFLGRRLARCRALVVVTFRDDEVGTDHPLAPIVGELSRQPEVVRVDLAPLSPDAVAQLVEKVGSTLDPARLHTVTGGNPFFVTEVLAGGDYSTVTVRDAVLARLGGLDQEARTVVEAVSVDPRALETAWALDLTGVDPAAAERALRAGVLLEGPEGLRFRHELARRAVGGTVPPLRRRRWHARLVELLLAQTPPDLSRVVHHAVGAQDPAAVLRHGPAAAQEAARRGATREAAELLDEVLAVADALPGTDALAVPEQVRLRLEAAQLLGRVDRQQDALRRATEAVDLARTTGDVELVGRSLTLVARSQWITGSPARCAQTLGQALELLRPAPPGTALAGALSMAANIAMLARHRAEAVARAREAVEVAERVGSDAQRDDALISWGGAELVMGDADTGIAILQDVLDRADARQDRDPAARTLGMLGSGGGEARRYEQAYGWLERAVEGSRALDLDYNMAYDQAWQARIRCEQGRWDEATALARGPAALPVGTATISPMTALSAIGRIRLRRGDPGAREALDRVLQIGGDAELQHRWPALCALAELAWLQGRPQDGRAVLAGPWEESLATDSPWAQGEIGHWLWRCGGLDDLPGTAAEPYRHMVAGRWREAERAWARTGCPYERALSLMDGDDGARLEALGLLDRLGARPLARRLRGELRDAGLEGVPRGPRPQTRAHPAGLTVREHEVHQLLAEGLTYVQIAERLYISPRTVEHHVSAVLAKHGAARREDLPAPAAAQGDPA